MTDELKIISDDRIADAQGSIAEASTANTRSFARNADAVERISLAAAGLLPQQDHAVWLQVFLTRAGLANNTYAALAAATKYADAALIEYRKRYQPAAAPAPAPGPVAMG